MRSLTCLYLPLGIGTHRAYPIASSKADLPLTSKNCHKTNFSNFAGNIKIYLPLPFGPMIAVSIENGPITC